MGVKYVISDPPGPTWWARHKGAICVLVGLVGGFYLAGGCGTDASPAGPHPTPSHTPSVTATNTAPL